MYRKTKIQKGVNNMKKMKTLIVTGVMVLLLGATTAGVFASSAIGTPEENLQYKIERLQESVELGIITQERNTETSPILSINFESMPV